VSDVLPAGRERAYGHSICRNLNGGLSRTVSDHVRRDGTDWQAVPGLTRATGLLYFSTQARPHEGAPRLRMMVLTGRPMT
jgi:hypothetical protein